MYSFSKLAVFSFLLGTTVSYFSQTGKIGVGTVSPTENLDVKGTLRVRELPLKGELKISTTAQDQGSDTQIAFAPINVVVTDDKGVLGTKTFSQVVAEPFRTTDTADNSPALFVIKRYNIGDWPSGQGGRRGIDTGMSVNKWQAFLPGWQADFHNAPRKTNPYNEILGVRQQMGFRLNAQGTTNWRLIGDMPSVIEKQYIDILFIKKKYIAFKKVN